MSGGYRVVLHGDLGIVGWPVDVDGVGQVEDLRRGDGAEAVRMPGTSGIEYLSAFGGLAGGQTEVDIGGRVQSDSGVATILWGSGPEVTTDVACSRWSCG